MIRWSRIALLASLLGATALSIAAATRPAVAALSAYDGFDYNPVGGNLLGASGGLGFTGPWHAGGFNAFINDNFDIHNDPLTFGALVQTGRSIQTLAVNQIAGISRDLAAPIGQDGTTRYLSFLVSPEGTLHGGAFNGFLGVVLEAAGEPELYVGKPGGGAINRYVLEDRGGSAQVASSLETTLFDTTFLVVKAEFHSPGNDIFTLYTNPTPGAPEPLSGTTKSGNFGPITGLTFYSTGAMRIDELRLGETFADVTPAVPEPAGFVLLLVGTWALRLGRRSRDRPSPDAHTQRCNPAWVLTVR
jgi:hypothetical protein